MKTTSTRNLLSLVFLAASATTVAAQSSSPNWDGPYLGALVGYSHFSFDAEYTGPAVGGVDLPFNQDFEGFAFGGFAGYNFRNGNIVYGPEVDLAWLSGADADAVPGNDAGLDVTFTGHLRGRVGYLAQDNLLLYGGLGLAISDVDISRVPAGLTPVDNSSSLMYGASVGVGAEYAITNDIHLRLDYLYDYYPDQKIADTEPFMGNPFFPQIDTEMSNHTGRVGVSIALN